MTANVDGDWQGPGHHDDERAHEQDPTRLEPNRGETGVPSSWAHNNEVVAAVC